MTHDDWVAAYLGSDTAARNGDSIHGYDRGSFERWKAKQQARRGGYDPNAGERRAPGARSGPARNYCSKCHGPHVYKHGKK